MCLLAAAGIVALIAAFAGWSSGVDFARVNARGTADAEVTQQCALLPEDLASGKLDLAGARMTSLRRISPPPDCLIRWSPMATQAWLASLPSPTPQATATSAPKAQPTPSMPLPTIAPPGSRDYNLDALLAQAQAELAASDYPAAIRSLDAIISLDPAFQRDLTRQLILEALTTQAQTLFESGKLPEAIVLSERAEIYGDIGELTYLREVAVMLQNAQLLASSNPAESVRLMERIVYALGATQLMTYDMVGELQARLADYGKWLLPGDACAAKAQYEAALDLQPQHWKIGRETLNARSRQADQSCRASAGAATQAPIGQRSG